MKNKCKKCGRRYRMLTKKDLCVFCYYELTGEWERDFTSPTDKVGKSKSTYPMKFKGKWSRKKQGRKRKKKVKKI